MNAQAEMNIEPEATPSTDIVIAENLQPLEVFGKQGGLDPIIEGIKKQVRNEVFDVSTPEGRKRIASVAKKIGGAKAQLEKMAMGLTEDWRSQTSKVNAEKKRMKEELDALRDEIKDPLDEYRNREKVRVEEHERRLQAMADTANFEGFTDPDTGELKDALSTLEKLYTVAFDNTQQNWEEFSDRAKAVYDTTLGRLQRMLEAREKHEAEQAELEKLRKEKEERERKEHEERIAKEAAEKARVEAEQKAQREKEEAAAKAKAEQERIEHEKAAADKRAADAEQARIDAEAKAKADAKAAAEKAEADKQAAIEKERADAEDKRKAEADATAKREADKKHRDKINQDAAVALSVAVPDLIMHQAVEVVEAIAAGKLPGVKINY